jgi:hypothetical protein
LSADNETVDLTMATYTVAPTGPVGLSGDEAWRIFVDGEQRDGFVFHTPGRAEEIAERYRERDRLDALVEAAVGQEYHYDIRVWAELQAGKSLPVWRITDPHRNLADYAFAHYRATPPAVDVYTREQYESACAAVGLTADADEVLGGYADEHFQTTAPIGGMRGWVGSLNPQRSRSSFSMDMFSSYAAATSATNAWLQLTAPRRALRWPA